MRTTSVVRVVITAAAFALALVSPRPVRAQPARAPQRTILAIGAHAGDMELTTGAVLRDAHDRGDRVVILHLTLGEGGNPKLSPAVYGAQKKREALAVGAALGAEVIFAPYRDGEVPNDDATRRYVADIIRTVQPTYVFTHWKASMHKDHANTSAVVQDAVLLASLAGVVTDHPAWRGVRALWYADNWEDAEGFTPYVFVKVSPAFSAWKAAVSQYEFALGVTSGFAYVDYYAALATVRGAIAHKGEAVAFAVEPYGMRRVLDSLPR